RSLFWFRWKIGSVLKQAATLEAPREDLLDRRQDRAPARHVSALLLELVDHIALIGNPVRQRHDMLVEFLKVVFRACHANPSIGFYATSTAKVPRSLQVPGISEEIFWVAFNDSLTGADAAPAAGIGRSQGKRPVRLRTIARGFRRSGKPRYGH